MVHGVIIHRVVTNVKVSLRSVRSVKLATTLLKKGCDEVCERSCTGGGPEGCTSCKEGYKMEEGSCQGQQ